MPCALPPCSFYQLQHVPQARILRKGKIRLETGGLLSQLRIAHVVTETEFAILLRIKSMQRRRRPETLNDTAAAHQPPTKRHGRGRHQRGILQGAMNLRLHKRRLLIGQRQKMELMTVSASTMAGARIARVDPEG